MATPYRYSPVSQSPRVLLLFLVVIFLSVFIFFDKKGATDSQGLTNLVSGKRKIHPLLKKWKECMLKEAAEFRGDYERSWKKGWGPTINKCGEGIIERLNAKEFENLDEIKYHILPVVKKEKSTIVTLGIGRDITAEEKLRDALGKENVQFFGADPIVETNEKLYSKIGRFFPFAVGAKAGYSVANVYAHTYIDRVVVHVDLIYFLTKMIDRTFYDSIWLDAEHAEYGLFDAINRGGLLDQNGITICQWNMEIHNPDAKKKQLTHDFLFQQINDERYGYFHHKMTARHYRLYVVNFDDERCVQKYLANVSD